MCVPKAVLSQVQMRFLKKGDTMKKEEFFFDSRDGESKIHAVRYTPDDGKVKCILQIIHGMAEYAERYEEFAEYMTERGVLVTGEDHLGHGKSVPEGGTYGYFCRQDPATVVVRDAHRLKKITQELYPQVPIFILGHSMGSFILRNYLCRYGKGIQGAIIMGTGMTDKFTLVSGKAVCAVQKLIFGEKHEAKWVDKTSFASYGKRIKEPRTKFDWISCNEANVDRYMKDPLCGFVFTVNGFQTLFELIWRLHKKDYLKNIPESLPILMISGSEDPVGAYTKGVKLAYESLKEAGVRNIELKFYENDRHEILNEDDREQVMEDIRRFILESE